MDPYGKARDAKGLLLFLVLALGCAGLVFWVLGLGRAGSAAQGARQGHGALASEQAVDLASPSSPTLGPAERTQADAEAAGAEQAPEGVGLSGIVMLPRRARANQPFVVLAWRRDIEETGLPPFTVTDSDGRFQFDSLAPGTWSFTAKGQRRVAWGVSDDVVLKPDEARRVLVEASAWTVQATVLNRDGEPAPHVSIRYEWTALHPLAGTVNERGELKILRSGPAQTVTVRSGFAVATRGDRMIMQRPYPGPSHFANAAVRGSETVPLDRDDLHPDPSKVEIEVRGYVNSDALSQKDGTVKLHLPGPGTVKLSAILMGGEWVPMDNTVQLTRGIRSASVTLDPR